jgi:hypothetical protein
MNVMPKRLSRMATKTFPNVPPTDAQIGQCVHRMRKMLVHFS